MAELSCQRERRLAACRSLIGIAHDPEHMRGVTKAAYPRIMAAVQQCVPAVRFPLVQPQPGLGRVPCTRQVTRRHPRRPIGMVGLQRQLGVAPG